MGLRVGLFHITYVDGAPLSIDLFPRMTPSLTCHVGSECHVTTEQKHLRLMVWSLAVGVVLVLFSAAMSRSFAFRIMAGGLFTAFASLIILLFFMSRCGGRYSLRDCCLMRGCCACAMQFIDRVTAASVTYHRRIYLSFVSHIHYWPCAASLSGLGV